MHDATPFASAVVTGTLQLTSPTSWLSSEIVSVEIMVPLMSVAWARSAQTKSAKTTKAAIAIRLGGNRFIQPPLSCTGGDENLPWPNHPAWAGSSQVPGVVELLLDRRNALSVVAGLGISVRATM